MAHASDGGGSIRIPASCCGLIGLKTSQGRITLGPQQTESGLSVQFCVSRSVRDSARLLDAVHDPLPDDPMAGMKRAAEWVPFTPPFNVSGQPAINVPLHWNDAGLPVGVQLVSAYGREDQLIQVAAQLEAASPWAHRIPT